ncbi:MAG: hypothetical protein E6J90_05275 [Deltaproteobacteria bacterium]|nr:MAG: hypothetical protein E6J91_35395 [Deltaproteobacteria bacterium]TMQ25823.1 MAG: hypothetical protein E6J90_05275 [Deltaproteobacteria bacterium]
MIAMPKPVAVDGDTQVKTSSKKHSSDTNSAGKWQLVSSSVTQGSKLSVAAKLVEIGATASWSYVGGTAGSPPVAVGPFSDSATLTASTTRLKDKGKDLLVDGDQASGSVDADNKIVVTASQSKLRTA